MPLLFECISGSIDALLAQDSHGLGDVLPDLLDSSELDLGLGGDLRHAELSESLLLTANQKDDKNGVQERYGFGSKCSSHGGLTRCIVSSSTSLASSYFLRV